MLNMNIYNNIDIIIDINIDINMNISIFNMNILIYRIY
jgi:hypothetical protein